jgi:TonB-dependent receptor
VDFTLSHSSSDKYTYIEYGQPGDNMTFGNSVNPHPYGVDATGHPITYYNKQQTLTLSDIYNIWVSPTDADSSNFNGWVRAHDENFVEHIYNTSLDLSYPVSFSSDVSAKFKAGGKIVRSTHTDDNWMTFKGTSDPDLYGPHVKYMFPGHVMSNVNSLSNLLVGYITNPDYKRAGYFLNGTHTFLAPIDKGLYDQFMTYSQMDWNPKIYWPGVYQNDFGGAEMFTAGYLMGTFEIGSRLTAIAGLRFEQYNMQYKANFDYVTHGVYGDAFLMPDTSMAKGGFSNRVDRTDHNVFPNAQVRFKFNEWSDIRLAFSQGISRPDYNVILPSIYFEPGISASAGNPKLRPAISTNFDLALSFYSNEIGLFTISPFYKTIDNVFYQSAIYFENLSKYDVTFPDSAHWAAMGYTGGQAPAASQQITTYINNPHPAHVRGFELDWQTNFWYLPHPLNLLVLDVNYTRAWSDMDYQQEINTAIGHQVGRFTIYDYVTTDTIYNTRLVFQPNDVLNVAFGADYEGFSARVSFNLQGNVITSVGSRPEEDQYTGNIYRWDFTIQQKLPLEGLSIALSGTNIFNNAVHTYQDFRRVDGGPILHNEQSVEYSPRTFQAYVRYSF